VLDSNNTVPPEAAGPLKVRVPVELPPPITTFGLTDKLSSKVGLQTIRVPVKTLLPLVAVNVTEVSATTGLVLTEKLAELEPAKIVTLPTVAVAVVGLLLVSVNTVSDAAGEGSVTVPKQL
jgi:hypothetical protein